ncbi:hypothetical protein SUGI_1473720 [Cryptomeria japonica]|uniref:Transmembrane protein n=1 Tax=Cryptomeria japonica TaxID=3369 RepID=A0AAD3NS92_CRYJA|nr:hypothetical protein SUGI_1315230 [Cryptomeria japonica]GLJ58746.1 hypothetical protein SUGI_1473600 [Cryptomeria japonica]GLJ58748.1 hypothetical protein SUGI_1473720 [Cryptomeria japonica]
MSRSMLLKVMALLLVLNVVFSLAVSARPILNKIVNTNAGIDNLLEIVEMLASCPNCEGNIPDPSCC